MYFETSELNNDYSLQVWITKINIEFSDNSSHCHLYVLDSSFASSISFFLKIFFKNRRAVPVFLVMSVKLSCQLKNNWFMLHSGSTSSVLWLNLKVCISVSFMIWIEQPSTKFSPDVLLTITPTIMEELHHSQKIKSNNKVVKWFSSLTTY